MAEMFSLHKHYIEKQCRFRDLQTLFDRHQVVLVGEELGAFYLDKRIFQTDEAEDHSNDNDVFYPWDKRDVYATKISCMELVHAAWENGVRDIVIDMAPAMQEGLNEAVKTYRETNLQYTSEILFCTLLANVLASPMDAVIQMAGALDMRVHALNGGLTGIATLFRHARGVKAVPRDLGYEEKIKHYRANGFEQDKRTLRQIVRRRPTGEETETLRRYMELLLSAQKDALEKKVFDESPTQQEIRKTLNGKPFLGFFQNDRLFRSPADLDSKLRELYGEDEVARLSLAPDETLPKQAQYQFRYTRKNCTVAMTEDYARGQRAISGDTRASAKILVF